MLAARLSVVHIEIDKFLEKKQGRYVEAIRYADLSSCLKAVTAPAFLEGICVIAEQQELDRKMTWLETGPTSSDVTPPETLRHEIIRYHYEFRPHITADYVFERVA